MLTFDEAKALLSECTRSELQDHAFGDAEVYWRKNENEVAVGYFGLDGCDVSFDDGAIFKGDEARQLRRCGTLGRVERNDAAGRRDSAEYDEQFEDDDYDDGSAGGGRL